MDCSPLKDMMARGQEFLEEHFEGEDAFIRTITLVMEIDVGHECGTFSICSDDRAWGHRAFLEHAIDCLDSEVEAIRRDSDGD